MIKKCKKKYKSKGENRNNGITLIALIITIIVLLILAGVSIAMLTGENGILTKATESKEQTEIAQEKEEISMAYAGAKANKVEQLAEEVTASELQEELDKLNSEGEADDSEELKVTYPNGHVYTINQETGEITGPEEEQTVPNTATAPEKWEKTTKSDEEWYSYADVSSENKEVKVNAPKLKGAMTPIKYIGEDKEEQTGSKWANAITQDGSMFVWIPRYAYKITKGYHTNQAGTIEVIFIDTKNKPLNGENETIITDPSQVTYKDDGTGNQVQEQYLVHPAFTASAENGGGFGEMSGIWMAKFETTGEKGAITVKAGERTLIGIEPKDSYKEGKNAKFKESVDLKSHMAKNSEWGATVYLAHSKYGTNGQKVEQNTNSNYITGGSSTKADIYGTNRTQSTTHNAYGVYDINGGAWERVASYVDYGDNAGDLARYGGIGKGDLYGADRSEQSTSTEYKTVYKASGTEEENYNLAKDIKGDGVYETSNSYSDSTGSWFGTDAHFPTARAPFFGYGGGYYYKNAGIFSFYFTDGIAYGSDGFRVALVP